MSVNVFDSGRDKIDERLASLASMPGHDGHDSVQLQDRHRSPPRWKPSQRLAAPPPADASLRHVGNKSPPYRSKVVVPGSAEAASKASHTSTDRRSTGISREARPLNRSPVGDRSRDGLARRPRSENVPPSGDRQQLQPRPGRAAGDSMDQGRNNTSGAPRDAGRQRTAARGV